MSKRSDLLYLGHMFDAARGIRSRLAGVTREEFDANEDLQIIVTHPLQIIGEAARKTPAEARAAHPEIEWGGIIGMRHRLVHDYMDIKLDVVWDTATQDIPALIATLEKITPPAPPSA